MIQIFPDPGDAEGLRTCYCLNRDVMERFRQMAGKLSL